MDDDSNKKSQQEAMLRGCLIDFRGGPPIQVQEGTAMLEEVKHAKFPQWMRAAVAEAVKEKIMANMGTATDGKKPRASNQRNMHLHNYLTGADWENIFSTCMSFESKLRIMGMRFQRLGLVNPSEYTCSLANIIVQLASCGGAADKIDEKKHYSTLQDLKVIVKSFCKNKSNSGIAVYPDDPSELPEELFKKAYDNGEPAKCPLDITTLMALFEDLPTRGTHSSIRGGKSSRGFQRDDGLEKRLTNALMERIFPEEQPQYNLQINPRPKKRLKALMDGCVDDPGQPHGKEDAGFKEQIDGPQEVPEVPGAKAKSVDEMAKMIQNQLDENKEGNNKAANKEKPESTKKTKGNPTKSSAKNGNGNPSKAFPGTGSAAPKHFENSTVYTCPNSSSWRVQKRGDKKDKSFSWKKDKPKDVWGRVMEYVSKL